MVWAGSQEKTRPHPGMMKLTTTTLDADAEFGDAIDLVAEFVGEQLPSVFLTIDTRTSGTVTAIDISLQGSPDNVNWEDITTVTTKDSFGWNIVDYTSAAGIRKKKYRYVRHLATTVGAGNEHTANSYLYVE